MSHGYKLYDVRNIVNNSASPIPRVHSNSCPLSRWCRSTISSSVVPFSSLQSFPASGPFPMSQFFASGVQSIGASTLVLPMNIQDWFPLGLTGLILCCPRDFQESCPAPQFRIIDSRSMTLSNISFIFLIHASSLFICESILFSRFWIIFTVIILISLSGRLHISSSLL